MDSYGLIWTLMGSYVIKANEKIKTVHEKQWNKKAHMDSYGLIWTLMGSKQMGFNITWKRIAYIAHMDSYGLI